MNAAQRKAVSLILADDQDLVRGGLTALLNLEPDLEVVAQVGRGDHLLAAVREHTPDVALVDIEMPGVDGIEAVRQVVEAKLPTKCMIVTTFGRPGYLRRAMSAGALGFVVKDTPAEQLAAMVRKVAAGQRVVDPALAADSLAGGINPLTEREQEVLRATARGGSVKAIAAHVHLSTGTVRNHLSAAIGKTDAENRHDAARRALNNGWI
ncbi:response regulator transcription factor [Nesterenkonia haasae]|uniref:response regulator transcription factor n=1 Tax=Nesterenkonia haasae TaxID=2587813 RepID=UPI001391BD1A|nr:response regulator transcription factor [Nesterenkonia haasae]NDK30907.1 response regulator transcription factor [Nesterenkonia haasae]